jgi:DNA-binding NtrC family response regulator
MSRVLLVDDDTDVLDSLGDWLRRKHEVVVAHGFPHALLRLQDGPLPDVVVTDLDMPPYSGEDLLALVAARHPHVCRVLHTGTPTARLGPTNAHHVFRKGDDHDRLDAIIGQCSAPRSGSGAI